VIHLLDRRQALRWIARTSAGLAGMSLLGGCNRDETGGGIEPDAGSGSGSVDASTAACPRTQGDVLGPYYRSGAPSRIAIASSTEPGERLVLEGVVTDEACAPIAGAVLDIWQADQQGTYYEPDAGEPFRLRGKLESAADGTWRLETIKPGFYSLGGGLWRPAHIHFTVSHPQFKSVTTQIYFAGDPYLPPNDGCSGCGSDDPARVVNLVAAMTGVRGDLPLALAR
jgi:catechol 1,2-dioxygenase